MRRLVVALALLAALAASGCGSKSSSGERGLGDALSFVPQGAPVIVAVNTDTKSDQWKQVGKLLSRFPFSGQIKQAIATRLSAQGVDFGSDVRPLLGNDFVIAPAAAQLGRHKQHGPPLIAWKPKEADRAKALLNKTDTKVGKLGGDDLYRNRSGTRLTTIHDGVLVSAGTRTELSQAVARHDGTSHATVDEFNSELGALQKDALVRAAGNLQPLLAGTPAARQVKWVGALRTFGAALTAKSDGLAFDFNVRTAGGLTAADLPLASGATSPPVVRRPEEVGVGIRNLTQTIRFIEGVGRATDPKGFAHFRSEERAAGRQLGLDIERDVIARATGNASISIGIDHSFAASVPQSDPARVKALLARSAPRLPGLHNSGITSVTRGPGGLYVVHPRRGKPVYFGLIGTNFVVASDAARAAQIGAESPSRIAGAKGALVLALDAHSLANALARRAGAPPAVDLFTGALGDFTGSVESETTGLRGSFKLVIK